MFIAPRPRLRTSFVLLTAFAGITTAVLRADQTTSITENALTESNPPAPNPPPAKPKPENDITAKDLAVLYDNVNNPIIERFSLTGEFQLQWADGESNQGSYGTRNYNPNSRWGDIEVRRWRDGFESRWFDSINFWATLDLNNNVNPLYKDIYEVAISYSPSEAFNLGVGKIKTRYFSQEWNTRTRELLVFENSLLVNMIIPQQLTGVWTTGVINNWYYALALYSGDYENEFSRFDAGAVIQASIGYDFAKDLRWDKALVKFDYQGSTSPKNSNGPAKFPDAFSLNSTWQKGKFYGYTDLLGAIGRGTQSDVFGITLTPTYFIIDNRLQFITRYQYAHGDHDGLQLQTRYEDLAPGIISTKGKGDDYNAMYFGLNYYIYGHNLKLMAGTEYNNMTGGSKNFSGWTTLLGLRLAF